MNGADVAVVIVNYNGRWLLEKFFPSVVAAATSAKRNTAIYVVDNTSRDDSVSWLESKYPQVQVIRSPVNRMWGGGNNLGAMSAIKNAPNLQWLVFLNNDVAVPTNFIDGITDTNRGPADVGITGVKTVFLYPYIDISVEHGIDFDAKERRGTMYLELNGLDPLQKSRLVTNLTKLNRGYLVDRSAHLRVPVHAGKSGQFGITLAHRRDQETRLAVRLTSPAVVSKSNAKPLLGSIAPDASFARRAGRGMRNAVVSHHRLPYRGTLSLDIPWHRADTVDIVNNAGSWIDLENGECGDIGINCTDDGTYDRERVVDAICGVAMGVKREVFERLGGFDETYSLYFEDTDFCVRAKAQGIVCWYDPRTTVRHLHSATSGELSASWRYHILRSQFIFRARHQQHQGFLDWQNHMLRFASSDPVNDSVFQEVNGLHLASAAKIEKAAFLGRALCR